MKRRKYALFLFIITMMLNTGAAETASPLTGAESGGTLWDFSLHAGAIEAAPPPTGAGSDVTLQGFILRAGSTAESASSPTGAESDVTPQGFILNAGGIAEAAHPLTGLISSPKPEGFTLYTAEGPLPVTVTESTLWDTDGPLTEGDAAAVRLTEAEDGSLTAAVITCCRVRGQITEVNMTEDEEPFLMLQPEDGSEPIRVNLSDIPLRAAVPGIAAEIWYNGIMTRSVPPQITALYMRGTVLQGVITKVLESGNLLLQTDDGETVLLCLSEDTLMLTEPEIGKAVRASVYPAVRLSLPPQYEAQDVFEAETAQENPIMTEEKQ